jgi:hypothetical protein
MALGKDKRFSADHGENSHRMKPKSAPTKGKRTHAKSHLVVQKKAKARGHKKSNVYVWKKGSSKRA